MDKQAKRRQAKSADKQKHDNFNSQPSGGYVLKTAVPALPPDPSRPRRPGLPHVII
jgi:hypothetical protein